MKKETITVLTFCKHDITKKFRNAIGPPATKLASSSSVIASSSVARRTTWDEVAEERRASGVTGPPLCHTRQSSERTLVGHKSRRSNSVLPSKRRRGCAPKYCIS
jgi:hypothetical protein